MPLSITSEHAEVQNVPYIGFNLLNYPRILDPSTTKQVTYPRKLPLELSVFVTSIGTVEVCPTSFLLSSLLCIVLLIMFFA